MENRKSRALDSVYAKMSFGAALALIAVAGGIYVGHALIGASPYAFPQHSGTTSVEFDPGDPFPAEDCLESDGTESSFDRLLTGKETVLLFVDFGCKPCMSLLEHWDHDVAPALGRDVQVVVCISQDHPGIPDEYKHLIEGKHVVYYDGMHFAIQYNMVAFPTIVGIDKQGLVNHIRSGFATGMESELLELFAMSDR